MREFRCCLCKYDKLTVAGNFLACGECGARTPIITSEYLDATIHLICTSYLTFVFTSDDELLDIIVRYISEHSPVLYNWIRQQDTSVRKLALEKIANQVKFAGAVIEERAEEDERRAFKCACGHRELELETPSTGRCAKCSLMYRRTEEGNFVASKVSCNECHSTEVGYSSHAPWRLVCMNCGRQDCTN